MLVHSEGLFVDLIVDVGHPVRRHLQGYLLELVSVLLRLRRGILLLAFVLHVVFGVLVGPHSKEFGRPVFHAFEILLLGETHCSVLFIVSHAHSILLFVSIFGQSHGWLGLHVLWAVESDVLVCAQLFLVIWVDLFVLAVDILVDVL